MRVLLKEERKFEMPDLDCGGRIMGIMWCLSGKVQGSLNFKEAEAEMGRVKEGRERVVR